MRTEDEFVIYFHHAMFTLHSGQMRTFEQVIFQQYEYVFTLHSGQMRTDGVKLLIVTRFNLFR